MSNSQSINLQTIIDSLNWRYATKEFDATQKINKEEISQITEILRLTPSSFGLQPWKFYIISNPEIREKLKVAAWNQAQITDCSHLVVIATKLKVELQDVEEYIQDISQTRAVSPESLQGYAKVIKSSIETRSTEELQVWAQKQAYIALGNLLTAVAEAGIDACPMEGFSPKDFDRILNLHQEGYTATVLCPLGYRSQTDKTIAYQKVRYSQDKVIKFLD